MVHLHNGILLFLTPLGLIQTYTATLHLYVFSAIESRYTRPTQAKATF